MNSAYMRSAGDEHYFEPGVQGGQAVEDGALPPLPDETDALEQALFYLRVSSPRQTHTASDQIEDGNSIDTQRRYCEEKAHKLGAVLAREPFIEPGRSAQSVDKRPVFRQMMAYLAEHPEIKYVIIYMRSRVFRNHIDAAIYKRQFLKMGVKLVSAKEEFSDDYLGDAMEAMTDIFNEMEARRNGFDVKIKMANKARKGGTISRAPIGYLNVTQRIDSREVRTVVIDPVRGPLIRLAFELYATGEYTFEDLSAELYDRGLRTRPTRGRPEQAISDSRLSVLLRDPYYKGIIVFEDEEIDGWHEPLVSPELFDQVQEVIEVRTTAKELRRVHHSYLKGSLFCGGGCRARGIKQRMIMQETTNRHGTTYVYFFCPGRKQGLCETSHIAVAHLEERVEDHYATIRFAPSFIAEARQHLTATLDDQQRSLRLLHEQLSGQLEALDTRESNLLDLAADGEMPTNKIKDKLREIRRQRRKLEGRLADTETDLGDRARVIELALRFMEDPQAAYLRADEQQRRLMNQAIFHALYVEEDRIVGHELREPFANVSAVHEVWRQDQVTAPQTAPHSHDAAEQRSPAATEDPSSAGDEGSSWTRSLQVLLGTRTELAQGSSGTCMVGDTGFEPVTSSV